MRVAVIGVAWVMLGLVGCGGSDAPPGESLVPIEHFLGHPREPVGHQRSPEQTQVAFLQASPGRHSRVMNLFVQKGAAAPVQITSGVDRDVSGFRWFSEHRLGFLRDPDGSEGVHLYGVNADGSHPLELTPAHLRGQDSELLWPDPAGADRWMVAIGPPHGVKDLFWINVQTGESGLRERNPGNVRQMLCDPDGRALIAWSFDGQENTLLHRVHEAAPFRTVRRATYPDLVQPIQLDGDGHLVAFSNLGRDKLVKVRMALDDGQITRVLARDPSRDLHRSLDSGRCSTPGWLRADLGPRAEPPGILARHPRHPLEDQGVPVSYGSRDGLVISAFLHLPGSNGPGRGPAVILCHGGPAAAVMHGGDPLARFLASRGLVVLEPNFRGSTSYGKEFQAAGFGQWGRAMQDDLADGAQWLIDNGFADPARIGILGGSYGGYAALAGAALHPETYRCAVALAGPSNLLTFLDSPFCVANSAFMRLVLGDPRADAERLRAVSPALNADRIRIPILIAHGARDSRVAIGESEQMVAALKARGKPVTYLPFAEEGHSLWCEKNVLDLFREVERFLGQHLDSRVAP